MINKVINANNTNLNRAGNNNYNPNANLNQMKYNNNYNNNNLNNLNNLNNNNIQSPKINVKMCQDGKYEGELKNGLFDGK